MASECRFFVCWHGDTPAQPTWARGVPFDVSIVRRVTRGTRDRHLRLGRRSRDSRELARWQAVVGPGWNGRSA
jgi:hypothetical protein